MQAYNNNPQFREQVLQEIKRHEELDAFIKGTYGDGESGTFKGCAIGCTVHSLNLVNKTNFSFNSHESVAEALSVDVELCYLVDHVFENIATERRRTFTYQVWSSIATGVNTADVARKVKIWILEYTLQGLENNTYEAIDDVFSAVLGVITALKTGENLAAARATAIAAAAWAAWAATATTATATATTATRAATTTTRADFYTELEQVLIQELRDCK